MFLTESELQELTGYLRPANQRRWLDQNSIPYWISSRGRPKVLRAALEQDRQPSIPPREHYFDPVDEPWEEKRESPASWFEREAPRILVTPDALRASALPYAKGEGSSNPGIYFILNEGRIIYVGKAVNISLRLWEHFYASPFTLQHFNELSPLPPLMLAWFEAFYIFYLDPEHNARYRMPSPIVERLVARARGVTLWPI